MPELPEVETVVRALNRKLTGRVVRGVRVLGKTRVPCGTGLSRKLCGLPVVAVRRRAKYIVIECAGGLGLLAHLGMTGSFRIEPMDVPRRRHDRIAVRLDGGDELRYEDARRFGFVKAVVIPGDGSELAELRGLGIEPLSRAFGAKMLQARVGRRKTPVKTFIMDQGIVVGVGNIYASEALFASGMDPRRPVDSVTPDEWGRLAREIKKVLRRALKNGGSTIRDYRGVNGAEGAFQRKLKVYGRAGEACRVCGTAVASIRQAGRSTFYCPTCQR
ncbi:MAG: bifunctional DNA-formamidopyrimidine glycosylase/DNA-(apurinic or apyrimidinic site) lyase [Planctomycetota bacterium]|jgi:formamidopyrimidine-DNA glycosylase|nr:bifunctional DNA-formamidopyrimidine glycosylase/DNA-(apurinic or apyrimidinic site) lyase [Planctomycetota bacterium]